MNCAVSGTFDPITVGHLDIIRRAAYIFDKVYVLVSRASSKSNATLSYDDKVDIIKRELDMTFINGSPLKYEIAPIEGTLIDTLHSFDVNVIIRGLRNGTDLIYEMDMSSVNRDLDSRIETVYLPCKSELSYVSSSMVRELCKLGKYLEASKYTTKYAIDKIHRKQMKLVALTGGIACGKSEVQRVFEENGWLGIDLDVISNEILSENAFEIIEYLNKWYNADLSMTNSHSIVKQKIAKLIFSNSDARKWIEDYLHPRIIDAMWKKIYSSNSTKVVVQVPLLFETGMDKLFDVTICVASTKEQQIERMVSNRNMTIEDAKSRIESQMPIYNKMSKSDYVIDNSGGELRNCFPIGEFYKFNNNSNDLDSLREKTIECIVWLNDRRI